MTPLRRFCAILVVLGAAGAWGYFSVRVARIPIAHQFTDPDGQFTLDYWSPLERTAIPDPLAHANLLLRLVQKKAPIIFSVRRESNIGAVDLSAPALLEQLTQKIGVEYPQRFTDVQHVAAVPTQLDGVPAIAYDFSYLGGDQKTRMHQQFIALVKTHDAYYFAAQCPEQTWATQKPLFDQILHSVHFLH